MCPILTKTQLDAYCYARVCAHQFCTTYIDYHYSKRYVHLYVLKDVPHTLPVDSFEFYKFSHYRTEVLALPKMTINSPRFIFLLLFM
jgi:hypothetical protein